MSVLQFNLLPDVKLEYNRAQAVKKLVYTLSALAVGVVLILTTLSFVSVNVLQKKLLSDADKDINTYSQKIKNIEDLDKVLTIQNQLNSLPGLHDSKHLTSQLFVYLPQLVPVKAQVSKLSLDTSANILTIDGTANTLQTVNRFVDTLKFTTYRVPGSQETKPAFSGVRLTQSDRNDKEATYTIEMAYDPALFDAKLFDKEHKQAVKLNVPKKTTTRSVVNAPDVNNNPLFNTPADQSEGGGQ